MNLRQLSLAVAKQEGKSYNEVAPVIKATFEAMRTALTNEETVVIRHFGTFYTADRSEAKAFNVRTSQPIAVPAHRVARFRPAENLRKVVRALGLRGD